MPSFTLRTALSGSPLELCDPESSTFWVDASRVIPLLTICNVKKQNEKKKGEKTKKTKKTTLKLNKKRQKETKTKNTKDKKEQTNTKLIEPFNERDKIHKFRIQRREMQRKKRKKREEKKKQQPQQKPYTMKGRKKSKTQPYVVISFLKLGAITYHNL